MEKQLKDYLHLYLPCRVEMKIYDRIRTPILKGFNDTFYFVHSDGDEAETKYFKSKHSLKPILRPLSDMEAISQIEHDEQVFLFSQYSAHPLDISIPSFEDINRLANAIRKAGFDCDGLIYAGLAIDARHNSNPPLVDNETKK